MFPTCGVGTVAQDKKEAQATWVAEEEPKRFLGASLKEKLFETECGRGIAENLSPRNLPSILDLSLQQWKGAICSPDS